MRIVVWKSSATVSVSTPPTPSSAVRRTIVADPHQNIELQRSLPGPITSKKSVCSCRTALVCWIESRFEKSWGVCTSATFGSVK